jgi:LysM repeat protein
MVINLPRFTGQAKGRTEIARNTKDKPIVKPAQEERIAKSEKTQVSQPELKQQPQGPVIHVVRKGETLKSISNKYNINIAELKATNNLKSNRVSPNMKLKLAGFSQKGSTQKEGFQKRSVKKKAPVKYHVVKKGETLRSISNRYNVDIADIKLANNIKGNKVIPKQKLKIVTGEG